MLALGIGIGIPLAQSVSDGGVAPPAAPVNTAAPVLTMPNGLIGDTITVDDGTWTGSPDSYEYRLYVDGVLTWVTSNTFVLTSAEAGLELYYEVRAHNALGWSAWVASNTETTIALTAPFVVAAPVITDVGYLEYAIVTPAVWGGNPPSVTESYQWWEIYDGWSEWQPISSGANFSYIYAGSQSGGTIKCQVLATNGVSPDAEVYSNEIVVPS